MGIRFYKQETTSSFISPLNDFKPTTVKIELRRDPLTPHRTRIVPFRFRVLVKEDLGPLVEKSLEIGCPFCPENLQEKAARFMEDWVPGGFIKKGEAVLFPNAFPYEKHSGVCVLCSQHFVPIEGFKSEWILQALSACQDYFRLVKKKVPLARYGSINWNFIPLSGAGLIHPHFQVMAQDRPTRYLGEVLQTTKGYLKKNGRPFFADYIRQEKKAGERYIGNSGKVHWFSAFAPMAILEIMALWEGSGYFLNFSEGLLKNYADGLVQIMNFLGSKNIYSLNMALYLLLEKQDHFSVLARILPRIEIPPMNVSEINYFERLHHEMFTFFPPEMAAAEARNFFQPNQEVKP